MRAAALLLCVLVACAHGPRGASPETLKHAAEELHQRARWRDWRGVAELVVPERRQAFLAARKRGNDERDLTLTDYDILDVRISDTRVRGIVVSRIAWVRLPSVTEQHEEVTSRFEFIQGTWYLDSQEGGPFAPDLNP
jgi:hypothetical protein